MFLVVVVVVVVRFVVFSTSSKVTTFPLEQLNVGKMNHKRLRRGEAWTWRAVRLLHDQSSWFDSNCNCFFSIVVTFVSCLNNKNLSIEA